MAFVSRVKCEDGTIYELKGEGGNIQAYCIRSEIIREALSETFDTIPEALNAIEIHAGSNVFGDTYELYSGDDGDYWPDDYG
jgi:hypothetical protein